MYKIVLERQAEKDLEKIKKSPLKTKLYNLLEIIEKDPFIPPYEKLIGDLQGAFSRRINIQHRLVYQIYEDEKVIKIISMWGHYEDN